MKILPQNTKLYATLRNKFGAHKHNLGSVWPWQHIQWIKRNILLSSTTTQGGIQQECVLPHLSHLAPINYYQFRSIQNDLRGKHFLLENRINSSTKIFPHQNPQKFT